MQENTVHGIQQELLSGHTLESNCALISFTLNIPGPIKVFPYTIWAFYEGIRFIESCLTTASAYVIN